MVLRVGLHEGTRVEVATHFTGSWTHGFEVAALHGNGCRLRRISDGAVLPIDFDYADVRALPADPVAEAPLTEMIARFEA